MGSAVEIKEGGVEVEEATREVGDPLAVVETVLAVLNHEDPELIQTLQLHVDLAHDVVVACLKEKGR